MGRYVENFRNRDDGGLGDLFRVLLAVFLPPVAVFLVVGFGVQFWINVLLTILGYLPGMIHAIWMIVRR